MILALTTSLICASGPWITGRIPARMTPATLPAAVAQNLWHGTPYVMPSSSLQCTKKMYASSTRSRQIYGIATYDALFKYVLGMNDVRPSFLSTFAPDLPIVSSEQLDEYMNPTEQFQLLRNFLHAEHSIDTVKKLSSAKNVRIIHDGNGTKSAITPVIDQEATLFLHNILGRFEEIRFAFPKRRYNGTMDFVCKLATGDYAMIEMQVIPKDYWDRRALMYVAAFYGNQMKRGESVKHIRKVIGINILGGGKDDLAHWEDTPDQFVRHYKFQEQLHQNKRYIDGIELMQYSIMNAPKKMNDQAQQDWVAFFREGHYMTEEDVKQRIKTPAVLRAFECAILAQLPSKVDADYKAEDEEYNQFSQFTSSKKAEGKAEGATEEKKIIARALKEEGVVVEIISKTTGLTTEQIRNL